MLLMAWFKLCLSWTVLSAAALGVSCQELTSTLREGNHACPGDEVIFTCTTRVPNLSSFAIEWTRMSPEYINGPLQFTTSVMPGTIATSVINGNVTVLAAVTKNTDKNGLLILESELRIVAVQASTVTCSSTGGGIARVEFDVSGVPGVPQRISAVESSRSVESDNMCIILVTWDPPANSDPSDIDQYIIYVPSRNIKIFSSSTMSTFTVSNCDDLIRIQVAAVNRFGCVGMNSSEVQPTLLGIPTLLLGLGAAVGMYTIPTFCFLGLVFVCIYYICAAGNSQEMIKHKLSDVYQDPEDEEMYNETYKEPNVLLKNQSTTGALRAELKKAKAVDIRDGRKSSLEELKDENDEVIRDGRKSSLEELKDENDEVIRGRSDELYDYEDTYNMTSGELYYEYEDTYTNIPQNITARNQGYHLPDVAVDMDDFSYPFSEENFC